MPPDDPRAGAGVEEEEVNKRTQPRGEDNNGETSMDGVYAVQAAEIERLRSLTAELAAMLGECEWLGEKLVDTGIGMYPAACCLVCEREPDEGHTPDCRLAALIREGEEVGGGD